MLKGDSAYLMSAMAQYGYSLLQPDQMADPNELLASLAQSRDSRVLEGFPVVLANALAKHGGKVDLAAAESGLDERGAEAFRRLVDVSLYLMRTFGFDALASEPRGRRAPSPDFSKQLPEAMVGGVELSLDEERTLSPGRLKRTFMNYFVRDQEEGDAERKMERKESFRREYLLSLFFAPRQRDLVAKRMRGEPLTKTEREYYSRVVKKKLQALADPDLHMLAQKALRD